MLVGAIILTLLTSFISFILGMGFCISAIRKLSPEAYVILKAKLKKEDE